MFSECWYSALCAPIMFVPHFFHCFLSKNCSCPSTTRKNHYSEVLPLYWCRNTRTKASQVPWSSGNESSGLQVAPVVEKSNQSTIRYSSHSRTHSVPNQVCQSTVMISNTSATSHLSPLLQLLAATGRASWWSAARPSYNRPPDSDFSGLDRNCFLSSLAADISTSRNLKRPWWQEVRQHTSSLWARGAATHTGPPDNSSDTTNI